MKIEIEFQNQAMRQSQRKKISPIPNAINQQGLDAREFSIEMDIGSNGAGDVTQFPQRISSVLDSMNQQGLKAKEVELEKFLERRGKRSISTPNLSKWWQDEAKKQSCLAPLQRLQGDIIQ